GTVVPRPRPAARRGTGQLLRRGRQFDSPCEDSHGASPRRRSSTHAVGSLYVSANPGPGGALDVEGGEQPRARCGPPDRGARAEAARRLQADTAAAAMTDMNAVAIVGMAGRFPGARSVHEFWTNLVSGVESIS